MENYIQAEDYELWMLIKNGPLVPTKVIEDGKKVPRNPKSLMLKIIRKWKRMPRLRSYYILA